MNIGFLRSSFEGSDFFIFFGWILGIIVSLLLFLEPEEWYRAAAPAAEAVPTPAASPETAAVAPVTATPAIQSIPAIPASPAAEGPRPHYLPPRPVQKLPPPSVPQERQKHHEDRLAELLSKIS